MIILSNIFVSLPSCRVCSRVLRDNLVLAVHQSNLIKENNKEKQIRPQPLVLVFREISQNEIYPSCFYFASLTFYYVINCKQRSVCGSVFAGPC